MAYKLVLVALACALTDAKQTVSKEVDAHALAQEVNAHSLVEEEQALEKTLSDEVDAHALETTLDEEKAAGDVKFSKEETEEMMKFGKQKVEALEGTNAAETKTESTSGTSPNLVSGVSVLRATSGRNITITLIPSGSISTLNGGKAVFIPEASGCRTAEPTVTINSQGEGRFRITGQSGMYKVCFQAAGFDDSVEQVSATNNGQIEIELFQATDTAPDTISAIYPRVITVNVPTMLDFEGAGEGDQAIFVNSATGNCSAVEPTKEVGIGHNIFTIVSTGTFKLCYRVPGASDSVEQTNVSLQVRAPGVSQDMTNRWPRYIKKDGNLDCVNLTMVPFCSRGLIDDCDDTFVIDHGIGYKCFWDDSLWPPACTTDKQTEDASMICRTGSCGGHPVPSCW